MDASLPVFVGFKHSSLLKEVIINCPPNISRVVSPATSGLVDLQQVRHYVVFRVQTNSCQFPTQILKAQIRDLTRNPDGLRNLPHSTTIYHELLRPEAYRSNTVPNADSLYDEAQALLFAGADTTGMTLMHGSFYVLTSPNVYQRLKEELVSAWPILEDTPDLYDLQKLPYLV